ncbi:MAG: PIN/TRAM domain-containing protein [Herpetosiphon sp.]
MKFTPNFYSRVVTALLMAYAGYRFGLTTATHPPTPVEDWAIRLLTLSGAGLGLLLGHHITLYPLRRLKRLLVTMTALELVIGGLGLIGGLMVGVLLTVPLARLPSLLGAYLPISVAVLSAYLGVTVALARRQEFESLFKAPRSQQERRRLLLDTNVIIDGRISGVVRSGFLTSRLVVPSFVLQEIQHLADAEDELTRAKGKRGLHVLQGLQSNPAMTVDVIDRDIPTAQLVDDKLIALARAEGMTLLTNDSNLERVATLQNVQVLNLNTLADAVKTPFVTGDHLQIAIRSEGRERQQGVGFLQDGTMVVVEEARHLVGKDVPVVITRLYTTQTGKIIFAQLDTTEQGRAVGS